MKPSKTVWLLRAINILLPLNFAFPLFPLKISALILVITLLVVIAYSFMNRKEFAWHKPPLAAILLAIIPLLYLAFFFVSLIPSDSWFHFEKKMALLAMPITFYLLAANKYQPSFKSILRIFSVSSVFLSLVGLLTYVYCIVYVAGPDHGNFIYIYRTLLEQISGLHPTYFGLVMYTGLFIHVFYFKNRSYAIGPFWNGLAMLALFSAAFLSGSRSPLIGFIFALLYIGLTQFGLNWKYRIGVIGAFVAGIIGLIQVPVIGSRIQGMISLITTQKPSLEMLETSHRVHVWLCGLGLVRKHWLFGLGTEKIQYYLNLCYEMFDAQTALNQSLNTHNEYINIWLGTGLIGILIFMAFLIFSWKQFKDNWLARVVLILFAVVCLTENLLERQHGVFYAAFFLGLFLLSRWDTQSPLKKSSAER